ncbi:hypothetical protein [Clostridium sp.]|uniref:hypothetical protein n=1 Tax=Clostridium sp. TaxID=1506 RepID=UPI001A631AD4|nr:hypothetical protein [Clostridium sp.]MBK5234086.1 hypothetical protein [Clostridium sp.]
MKHKNKIVIGIDQSYKDTGISVVHNNKLRIITNIRLDAFDNNSERRIALRKRLIKVFTKIKLTASKLPNCEVIVIIERIRLQSSGFINIDYIKSMGAINALIVDTAAEFEINVYSVDTRAWKCQTVGHSKPESNPFGLDPKKWPTIKFIIAKGYEDSLLDEVSHRKKKGVVKEVVGVKYTYNDNKADSACIALYGFIHETKQNLVLEH